MYKSLNTTIPIFDVISTADSEVKGEDLRKISLIIRNVIASNNNGKIFRERVKSELEWTPNDQKLLACLLGCGSLGM